jgi:hypothetical protein
MYRVKCQGGGHSHNKGPRMRWLSSVALDFENVPHLWTLPIWKHEANIIMNINIYRSKVGSCTYSIWLGKVFYLKVGIISRRDVHGYKVPSEKLQECFMAEGYNRFTQHRVELGWLPLANHDPKLGWIEYFLWTRHKLIGYSTL